jgi:hypothetical protein
MTDNNNAGSNVGRGLKNRNVLIAIALAILALIVLFLIMRGQGDEANNMSGPDTAATQAAGMNTGEDPATGGMANTTPGYGQPNPPPSTALPADQAAAQGAATTPPAQ